MFRCDSRATKYGTKRTKRFRVLQRRRLFVAFRVAVAFAFVAVLSSCGSTATSTSNSPPTTLAAPAAADTPTIVHGLPARSTVISASVQGTTGWVLTRGDDAGIWQVPAAGDPRRVVPESAYQELLATGVSIVAFSDKIALLAQRCDSDTTVLPECVRSSGVVDFFDDDGKLAHTTTLWNNKAVQAGGTPPVLLEAEPSRIWLDGIDRAYALGTSGEVIETVPRKASTNLCAVAGDLYALDWNGAGMPNEPGGGVPSEPAGGSHTPLTLWKWSGERWVPRTEDRPPNVAGLPGSSCGADGIMLWTGFALSAHWSPDRGWTDLASSSAPVPATRSDIGVGYTVSSTGSLERLDPETGKLVDLGLELGTSHDASRPPNGLVVAERGQSVFACTYAYNGTSGDAPVPPTVCGFTTTG